MSGGILHQVRWWLFVKKLDTEGCVPITYPQWSCCCDSVLWVIMLVIQSTIQWRLWAGDVYPSTKCTWSCRHPLPLHITWSLHPSSVDALADVHGRSHNFPLIHQGSLSGLMLGDHHTTILSWCILVVTPFGSGLNWGGAGTSVPCLADTHTQGNTSFWCNEKSQLWCRMCDCLHCSITSYKGKSVKFWCTTLWGSSSHWSLIFLFPWEASAFTKTRLPGFRSMASTFQS